MKRLLLLMTTHTYKARAFMEAAARLSIPTTVGTNEEQALAHLNPAGNLTINLSDPDGALPSILRHNESYPIGAIVAADDEGAVLAAAAAQALGLEHNPPEAVEAARNKRLTRERLAAAGLNVPGFRALRLNSDLRAAARRVSYPAVIKPLALSASRGVMRVNSPAEFEPALQRLRELLRHARTERPGWTEQVLVEDFIPGREVALEGLLHQGRLHVLALFDKPDPLDGPFFEETIYVTPSRLPAAVQQDIVGTTQRTSEALGLRQGPVHAELRVNPQGAWMLEAAPRSIGGHCARALRFGKDSSLEELILRQALGLEWRSLAREVSASGVMMIPIPQAGTLTGVGGLGCAKDVPGVEEVMISIPPGEAVAPPPEGTRYLGFIFARDQDPDAVECSLRSAHDCLKVDIAPTKASAAEAAG